MNNQKSHPYRSIFIAEFPPKIHLETFSLRNFPATATPSPPLRNKSTVGHDESQRSPRPAVALAEATPAGLTQGIPIMAPWLVGKWYGWPLTLDEAILC
jgi:hypothetical protein